MKAPIAHEEETLSSVRTSPEQNVYTSFVSLYAAYGLNMNPDLMSQRAPRSPASGSGWLHGWRLTFAGSNPVNSRATVVEDPEHKVFVALYDVPDEDAKELEHWSRSNELPMTKLRLPIQRIVSVPDAAPMTAQHSEFILDATDKISPPLRPQLETAWLYVITEYEGGTPTNHYLDALADAATQAGAPAEYLESLLQWSRPSR